ncbi:MAG: hypothetical protein ABFD92_01250 [Planctomycetaceae bacterium]|nr:hypothetical protein [Planctomycetaceae bacterium]
MHQGSTETTPHTAVAAWGMALAAIFLAALLAGGCQGSISEGEISQEGRMGASGVERQKWVPLVSDPVVSPWKTPLGPGRALETQHYRIFTTVNDRQMLRIFPAFMEAAYDNYYVITRLPRIAPGKKMPVYFMADRNQWVSLTEYHFGKDIGAFLDIPTGGYSHQGVGVFWQLQGMQSYSIASHEGLHQFLYYRMRNTLPAWLEEGLCTMAEGFQDRQAEAVRFTPEENISRATDLQAVIVNDRWIPLEKLLNMDSAEAISKGNDPLAFYAQVWALAMYLRYDKNYSARLQTLLTDAAAGTFHKALGVPQEKLSQLQQHKGYNPTVAVPLFRYYFANNLAGFEKAYRNYAERNLIKLLPKNPVLKDY